MRWFIFGTVISCVALLTQSLKCRGKVQQLMSQFLFINSGKFSPMDSMYSQAIAIPV